MKSAAIPQPRRLNRGFPLTLLFLTILAQLVVRLVLALQFLSKTDLASRSIALLNWQHLDQYIGWTGLILLVLLARPKNNAATEITRGARLLDTLFNAALALGIVLITTGVVGAGWSPLAFAPGSGSGAALMARFLKIVEFATAALLVLSAAPICLRQLAAISNDLTESRTLNLSQLWRLVAVQWTLTWAAAEVFLRIKYASQGGIAGIDTGNLAKTLLFALPAFGLLPNLLMLITIYCVNRVHPADIHKTRPRAWLVAFVAINAGALCLTLGDMGPRWLSIVGIAGIVPLIFAIFIFVAGFGKKTFRGTASAIPIAMGLFVIGILMLTAERILTRQQIGIWREYTAAWHFLIGCAAPLVWLLGLGAMLLRAFLPARLQSPGAAATAITLVTLGSLEITATLALAGTQNRNWLSGVFVGATLVLLGCLIASAMALRSWRVALQTFNSSQ